MRTLVVSLVALTLFAGAQALPTQPAHVISGIVVDGAGVAIPGALVDLAVGQRVGR